MRVEHDKRATTRRVWVTWGVLTVALVWWWYTWPKEGAFDCGLAADVVAHVADDEVTRVTLRDRDVAFNQGSWEHVNSVLVEVPELADGYFSCRFGGSLAPIVVFFAWPILGAIAASIAWRLHPSYGAWKASQQSRAVRDRPSA